MDHYKISGSKVSAIWNTDDFYRHVSYYTDKNTPNLPEWYIALPSDSAVSFSKGVQDAKASPVNNQSNTSQSSQSNETAFLNEKMKEEKGRNGRNNKGQENNRNG